MPIPSSNSGPARKATAFATLLVFFFATGVTAQEVGKVSIDIRLEAFRQLAANFCVDCHSGPDAEARLDVESLTSAPIGKYFADWRRVERVLADQSMPPSDAEQPTSDEFETAKQSLASALELAIREAASDPGPAALRRITNAEYEYCIQDLTGVRLDLKKLLIGDNVGGSGFTNAATGQFMNDATLERYLEAAKLVADHAMIGAGPLYFYRAPGQTGLELSSAERIQSIYKSYGFRASGGEGAEPYGLERFATAFRVTWKYRFREELGRSSTTLEEFAEQAGITGRFARHIWDVLHREKPKFPLSLIIEKWNQFPSPEVNPAENDLIIATKSMSLFEEMQSWQNRLADAAGQEEEAALLSGSNVRIPSRTKFRVRGVRKRRKRSTNELADLNDPNAYEKDGRVRIEIRVDHASDHEDTTPTVVFSNLQLRFDLFDGTDLKPAPLRSVLAEPEAKQLRFGENPGGLSIDAEEFSIQTGQAKIIELTLPDDVRYGELRLVASLDAKSGKDSVVRCTIRDVTSEFDPLSGVGSKEYSALLCDNTSSKMNEWVAGLSEFAKSLPQISHREPTPSDRDPIPTLYDNTYNRPERNFFHTAVKYYRVDDFLKRNVLPSEQLAALDLAWTDLLTSFNYHDVNLRFAAKKHQIDLGDTDIRSDLNSWVKEFPRQVQPALARLKLQYDTMQQSLGAAEQRHISDVVTFARSAWRRPLEEDEVNELRNFYHQQRNNSDLEHIAAIRATLVRVLVSPDFLYRLERGFPKKSESQFSLNDYEIASRLSFSIWSSIPDEELLSCANSGRLRDPDVLKKQVIRLLHSPKSRRLATELFGQWFGFYNFDEYRGVDVQRFPEFDQQLKNSLYDEATSFFEHLIREDRPYTEIIQANYTFLDRHTAKHYGIDINESSRTSFANAERALDHRDRSTDQRIRKVDVDGQRRGGLLGLGAILASTSAPLRTSPVKRGDWILRRLIGTPVPPPPADAGSIPAEEVLSDGLTVRQRLESHRTRAECMNCHVRIDPLGFALENFDTLGRWRNAYSDDQKIDASGRLASGESILGFDGLRKHLTKEDASFRRTFARKLVAYFLGRVETVSDAALIERITNDLDDDPRISTAVKTLVSSVQFRARRAALTPVE